MFNVEINKSGKLIETRGPYKTRETAYQARLNLGWAHQYEACTLRVVPAQIGE